MWRLDSSENQILLNWFFVVLQNSNCLARLHFLNKNYFVGVKMQFFWIMQCTWSIETDSQMNYPVYCFLALQTYALSTYLNCEDVKQSCMNRCSVKLSIVTELNESANKQFTHYPPPAYYVLIITFKTKKKVFVRRLLYEQIEKLLFSRRTR